MQKEGPTEDLVNRARETALREHETGMKQNGYWLSRIQAAKLLGRDPVAHVLERDDRINAVTTVQRQGDVRQVLPDGPLHDRHAGPREVTGEFEGVEGTEEGGRRRKDGGNGVHKRRNGGNGDTNGEDRLV